MTGLPVHHVLVDRPAIQCQDQFEHRARYPLHKLLTQCTCIMLDQMSVAASALAAVEWQRGVPLRRRGRRTGSRQGTGWSREVLGLTQGRRSETPQDRRIFGMTASRKPLLLCHAKWPVPKRGFILRDNNAPQKHGDGHTRQYRKTSSSVRQCCNVSWAAHVAHPVLGIASRSAEAAHRIELGICTGLGCTGSCSPG